MAVGPGAFRAEVEATLETVATVPPALVLRFDFLELCCGTNFPLARAMAAKGFVCGPCIDIATYIRIVCLSDFSP